MTFLKLYIFFFFLFGLSYRMTGQVIKLVQTNTGEVKIVDDLSSGIWSSDYVFDCIDLLEKFADKDEKFNLYKPDSVMMFYYADDSCTDSIKVSIHNISFRFDQGHANFYNLFRKPIDVLFYQSNLDTLKIEKISKDFYKYSYTITGTNDYYRLFILNKRTCENYITVSNNRIVHIDQYSSYTSHDGLNEWAMHLTGRVAFEYDTSGRFVIQKIFKDTLEYPEKIIRYDYNENDKLVKVRGILTDEKILYANGRYNNTHFYKGSKLVYKLNKYGLDTVRINIDQLDSIQIFHKMSERAEKKSVLAEKHWNETYSKVSKLKYYLETHRDLSQSKYNRITHKLGIAKRKDSLAYIKYLECSNKAWHIRSLPFELTKRLNIRKLWHYTYLNEKLVCINLVTDDYSLYTQVDSIFYDSKGRITKHKLYEHNYVYYEYDSKSGKLSHRWEEFVCENCDDPGSYIISDEWYTYDSKGRMIKVEGTHYPESNRIEDFIIDLKYPD